MDKFRSALESYCQFRVEYDCGKCAFHAACNIANAEKNPEDMTDREIEILFNNAVILWGEMHEVLDEIGKDNKSNHKKNIIEP